MAFDNNRRDCHKYHIYEDVKMSSFYLYNKLSNVKAYVYEPIPVAVVYDERNIPEGKTTKNNHEDKKLTYEKDESITTTEHGDIELDSTESVTEVVTEISTLQHAKKEIKPKGRTFNEFQIPVAVIYETETRRLRNNEELYVTEKPKTRRHGQQKTNVETVATDIRVKGKNNEVTEKEKNKHFKDRTDVATNFPKRTKGLDPVVPILESESYVFSHSGNFHYSYEGGDGTKAFERGELKTFDDNSKGEAVVGNYSYTDKDGKDFSLSYTADENGYRPVGAHLPTPPPIPPAIARALKYLATKKPDSSNEPVTKSYL